jgi:aprataxin
MDLRSDRSSCCTDRYPKARFHVLVLPKEKLLDLSYMTGDHVTLVEQMVKRGKALAKEKNVLSYKMGFHCVPSMAQVHSITAL